MKQAIFVVLLVGLPVPLLADEDYGSLPMRKLLDQCEAVVKEGSSSNVAKEIGKELLAREGMIFNLRDSSRGMACLEKIYEEEFAFDPPSGRFMRMSAAISVDGDRPERPKPDKMYERRLKTTCYAKLTEDEFAAMTEPLCANIFKTEGFAGE